MGFGYETNPLNPEIHFYANGEMTKVAFAGHITPHGEIPARRSSTQARTIRALATAKTQLPVVVYDYIGTHGKVRFRDPRKAPDTI